MCDGKAPLDLNTIQTGEFGNDTPGRERLLGAGGPPTATPASGSRAVAEELGVVYLPVRVPQLGIRGKVEQGRYASQ